MFCVNTFCVNAHSPLHYGLLSNAPRCSKSAAEGETRFPARLRAPLTPLWTCAKKRCFWALSATGWRKRARQKMNRRTMATSGFPIDILVNAGSNAGSSVENPQTLLIPSEIKSNHFSNLNPTFSIFFQNVPNNR